MKKIIFVLAAFCILMISITAFASDAQDPAAETEVTENAGEYTEMVNDAIDVLAEAWNDIYSDESSYPNPEYLLDIRSTRIVCIKDTLDEKRAEYFGDIKYVIEFLLFDEYIHGENHQKLKNNSI